MLFLDALVTDVDEWKRALRVRKQADGVGESSRRMSPDSSIIDLEQVNLDKIVIVRAEADNATGVSVPTERDFVTHACEAGAAIAIQGNDRNQSRL